MMKRISKTAKYAVQEILSFITVKRISKQQSTQPMKFQVSSLKFKYAAETAAAQKIRKRR